jgi:Ca2+-binding EF-hand superfamily protein
MFNIFDSDKSGFITREELENNFKKSDDDDLAEFYDDTFKKLDIDNDNLISWEEFDKGIKSMLFKSFKVVLN